MKKRTLTVIIIMSMAQLLSAQNFSEKNTIESIITEHYLVPVYLGTSLDKINTGFHEDFKMFVLDKGQMTIRTREEWIERLKKSREESKEKKTYAWMFESIDVEEYTACAKVRINENGSIKFVDYLTLYKFKEGWKIITKQFTMY